MLISHRAAFAAAGLLTIAGGSSAAIAQQDFPSKPVRLIVPFAPGGGTDIVARMLAQKLTTSFKQSVIVDNRAGGGGQIGIETAVRSVPDGYTTILMSGSYTTNAAVYKMSFDPVQDILPLGLIGNTSFIVAVHPGVQAKSIKDLVALSKAKPASINYGSSGTGGIAHLSGELFDILAGTKMTHVPYKGTGPALNDLLGGQIQLIFGSAPATIPLVKAGKLRGLAVTTAKRSSALPDYPTVAEAGVPGYEVVLWYGVLGPKGLSRPLVDRWNGEIRAATKVPDLKARLLSEGFEIEDSGPEVFFAVLKRDVEKWRDVVKRAKVSVSS
jgi:tripartite-type tricarboxylate transporter receptor subunit TctC